MKNAKRMLALASMTLAAGAMLGITPAQATPADAATTTGSATAKSGPYWDWDDEYVVGYYYNQWECNKAGWWGERNRAWSDYYCFPAWVPGWGNVWVLQVEENDWYWNKWNGGWPGGWPYKPNHFGKPFHVGGGYTHPFKFKKGVKYGKLNGIPFNPYQKYNGPKGPYDKGGKFDPPYGGGGGYPDNKPPYGGGGGSPDNQPPYGGGGSDNQPPYAGGGDNKGPLS
ncbi:hypothetical protein [Actinoplanes sp. G11-F43]|uniref:hypothetical protein n=1 Tax=Actinoplanes sp. G11-F43 TaxID=3424130 RepID=UPI003D34037E